MLWIVLPLWLQDVPPQPPRITQAVVVSAATEPVPLDALARGVTILTQEEIRRLPSWSIADVLRAAGSLEVRSRGNFGTQTDLSLRGGGFGQAVVLVDGIRLNDSQSGHHNGDIPVAIDQIERIEILRGTGSSLYGADAMTGAINVITRHGAGRPTAMVTAGEHGLVRGAASTSFSRDSLAGSVAAWGTRTSGFMFDRDLATGGATVAATFSPRRRIALSHLRNAFGANGFYGPSPSKEWTDQTLLSYADSFGGPRRRVNARASYRSHGDHFLWDVNRPGFAENRHRSQAVTAGATYRAGSDRNWTSAGAEVGRDWLRSNNLGGREVSRVGALVELQRGVGRRTLLYPALRYDHYSSYGGSWSPSLAAVVALAPAVRARASLGRAFRVPTFTERYYRDPAHLARADLAPERGWGGEAGADWTRGGVTAAMTVFARRETDVIDWVRAEARDPWRTANIREVRTRGLELSATRAGRAAFGRIEYTALKADAPELVLLSKYVADYARHSLAISGGLRLPGAAWLGARADCKDKVDGRSYCGVDARVGRAIGPFELFVEATNLFDVRYQEVKGVDMAPRWLAAGLRVGR
jgi:iron complex outermembrane receptor protein